MDNRQAMELARADISQQLTDLYAGLAGASPEAQINSYMQINSLITDARESEIAYLRQIKSIQDGINASIEAQRQDIMLSTMQAPEQFGFAYREFIDIISKLNAGGLDAQETQGLTSEAQSYIRLMRSLIESGFDTEGTDYDLNTMINALAAVLPEGLVGQYGDTSGAGFLDALLVMLKETAGQALGEEQQGALDQLSIYSGIISETSEIVSGLGTALTDAFGGLTDEYFIGLFQELQALANAALEESIAESRERLAGYNDELLRTTEALRTFGDTLLEITGSSAIPQSIDDPFPGGGTGPTRPWGGYFEPLGPVDPNADPNDLSGKSAATGTSIGETLLESMRLRDEMIISNLESSTRLAETVSKLSGKVHEIATTPPTLLVQVDGSIAPLISLIQSVQLATAAGADPGVGGMG